jgi:hypothetical protein
MRFFFFPRSLLQDACSQKVSKNLKIVCAQVTQTKTGLSAVQTFNPLEVNFHLSLFYFPICCLKIFGKKSNLTKNHVTFNNLLTNNSILVIIHVYDGIF